MYIQKLHNEKIRHNSFLLGNEEENKTPFVRYKSRLDSVGWFFCFLVLDKKRKEVA